MERGLTEEGCDQLMISARYDFFFPLWEVSWCKIGFKDNLPCSPGVIHRPAGADPEPAAHSCDPSRTRSCQPFSCRVPFMKSIRLQRSGPAPGPLCSCYRLSLMCRPVHMSAISFTGSYAAAAEINLHLGEVIAVCWCPRRTERVDIY